MTFLNILWWVGYIFVALLLQQLLPGFDALASGFFIALEERKKAQLFCLFILFSLIQEGTGSLKFGSSLLWYQGLVVLFLVSTRFFIGDNILSITILSGLAALYRGLIFWFMSAIQNIPIDYTRLLEDCLIQALCVPILWLLAKRLRPSGVKNGN